MSTVKKEGCYLIAEGEFGSLYIFIDAKKNYPLSPYIIYDGNDHAVFVRSEEEKIILDYINPEIRDKLRKAPEVMVVETIMDNIKTAYHVTMNIVKKLPIDWKKVGLSTWEEEALN